MWKAFSPEIRREIETSGHWLRPSQYGDGTPYPITRALIQEGRNHLLLGGSIDVGCPVRILQGGQDPDVPWQHAFALAHRLPADDVVLTMIQDGDHRLSRPQDIARITAAVAEMG
jgi:pimeloyl-ACP methyl ester carboxylesterase